MKHWPILLLALAPLAGCVNDPGPDVGPYDGPYVYDGGAYYADPRDFEYDYDQRALYGRSYYYPSAFPYYYGGYGRPRYWRGDRDHDDGDRRDSNDARGVDRTRDRSDDRSPAPRPTRADPSPNRAVPDRPSKAAAEARPGPSRSGNGARGGGPHGPGR